MRWESLRCWKQIQEILPERRKQVFGALLEYGPCTAGELYEASPELKSMRKMSTNAVHSRLTELVEQGCVKELPSRACKTSGYICIVYETIDTIPSKLPHRQTNGEKIRLLELEILGLKAELALAREKVAAYEKSGQLKLI